MFLKDKGQRRICIRVFLYAVLAVSVCLWIRSFELPAVDADGPQSGLEFARCYVGWAVLCLVGLLDGVIFLDYSLVMSLLLFGSNLLFIFGLLVGLLMGLLGDAPNGWRAATVPFGVAFLFGFAAYYFDSTPLTGFWVWHFSYLVATIGACGMALLKQ